MSPGELGGIRFAELSLAQQGGGGTGGAGKGDTVPGEFGDN